MKVVILDIRQEQPTDYDAVYQVIKEAFVDAEHTDGDEQNLVVRLRKSKSFIPELSLVAVEDEQIVEHILFTRAVVNGIEVLALAPLSVLPKYQNRGIGQSLIKQGHGYKPSVVCVWRRASFSADMTSSFVMRPSMDMPTVLSPHRSITPARQSQPSSVGIQVMSLTISIQRRLLERFRHA